MKSSQLVRWMCAALFAGLAAGCASTPEETPQQSTTEQTAPAQDNQKKAQAEAAIAAAKAAIDRAASVGGLWRDTESILAAAEDAYAAGDYDRAIELANKAREQAELGYQQAMAERERLARESANQSSGADSYSVVRGDNLWSISGKAEIYNDPYQWPLIYKANQDKIQDADLIFPGQNLSIERGSSQSDIDAAINHARTRGAWSVGAVEESDRAYLNQ